VAGRYVDQLLVGIKYVTDSASARTAMRMYDGITAGVIAAGAAVTGFVVAQSLALDEVAKTARTLDLTTEAWSRYQYAADLSGVSNEQLKTGLRALTVQIGGVAQGSAEAIKNFSAIGVEVQNVDGSFRTAAELLPEVADGLNRLDEGQRAAFRSRLLGESGSELATFLEGGSEGIRAMTDEADALGVTLNSDTAAAAEAFVDNLTRLKAVVTGAGMQLANLLLPAAVDATDQLVKMATASDGFIRLGLDRVVRAIGIGLDFLETPAGRVALGVGGIATAFGAVRLGGQALSPVLGMLGTGFGSMTAAAAPWLLLAAGIVLVLEDIYVTAQGGDSVIRRVADAFGYGEETARFWRDTLLTANAAMQAGILLGEEFYLATVDNATALAEYAASFDGLTSAVWDLSYAFLNTGTLGTFDLLLGYFDYDVWQTPLGRFLSWLGGAFDMSRALSGFRKLVAFASGDDSVQLAEDAGGRAAQVGLAPVVGLASSARRRRVEEQIAGDSSRGTTILDTGVVPGNNVDVQVAINAGSDPQTVAREAGRQVERETLQAYTFAEAF
jgi:hypothetical protein